MLLLEACTSPRNINDYNALITKTHPVIVSSKGELSPEISKKILDRLNGEAEPTDLIRRNALLVEALSGSPLVTGNKVTLLVDGPRTYAAMLQAIKSAREAISFETYALDDDEVGRQFAAALLKKRAEGVRVDLLYDSVGSLSTPAAFFQNLRDGGIEVREFNPVNPAKQHGTKWRLTQRDHKKILVVDGRIAITGGINISRVYSGPSRSSARREDKEHVPPAWRDTDVQIEGPAVAGFQKLFQDTWTRQNGPDPWAGNFPRPRPEGKELVQVIGSTPGLDNRITYVMYVSAFSYAQKSIHITTPYYAPDKQISISLIQAAKRSVDVKIILPGNSDSALTFYGGRSHYKKLLKAGVHLYERRPDSMLHAKTAVIDGIWSTVGSTNLDLLSFLHNDEVNLVILGPEFASQMEDMFGKDLKESKPITLEDWKRRSLSERIKEGFARLFAHWL